MLHVSTYITVFNSLTSGVFAGLAIEYITAPFKCKFYDQATSYLKYTKPKPVSAKIMNDIFD